MGILNEQTKNGATYLYGCDFGKTTADHVISVLNTHVLKETQQRSYKHLYLTCDNCAVNKNYALVGYAILLVACGKFDSVEINFPIAGLSLF
jgi:hypothetical protein